jgi:hypothetical protein
MTASFLTTSHVFAGVVVVAALFIAAADAAAGIDARLDLEVRDRRYPYLYNSNNDDYMSDHGSSKESLIKAASQASSNYQPRRTGFLRPDDDKSLLMSVSDPLLATFDAEQPAEPVRIYFI